jgi:hypothetical protein
MLALKVLSILISVKLHKDKNKHYKLEDPASALGVRLRKLSNVLKVQS